MGGESWLLGLPSGMVHLGQVTCLLGCLLIVSEVPCDSGFTLLAKHLSAPSNGSRHLSTPSPANLDVIFGVTLMEHSAQMQLINTLQNYTG